ncbi:MAG: DMT family transporter [Desulfobacter sp.]|nr:MAG: DMT family transporter [Desulfobacter sp.]
MMPYLHAMGAILCWASLPAAIGSGLTGLSIPALMAISFTSAAIFLAARDVMSARSFALYFPGKKASFLGIWGIFIYHLAYYGAMDLAPMAEGTILATTWSFWIVVFSSVLRFRAVKPAILATALAGLLGAGLVISSGKEMDFRTGHMLGYGMALFCGLVWSSFTVALPRLKLKKSPMTAFTIYAALLSDLIFIGSLALGRETALPGARALFSAVYLGCIPLGLSFFFWDRAVTTGNVAVIGYLSYLTPPLAVLLVALVHGQPIHPQVILGMGVIITSAILGKLVMDRIGTG